MMDEPLNHSSHIQSKHKTIRHLVFSGGIIYGFSFYGAFKRLHDQEFFHIDNIQTIYATSVGTMLATMISLKYEWEVLDNYLIKRPWQNVFKFSLDTIIECYQKRGLFSIKIIEEILEPLFRAKELDIQTITMAEFYHITGIEHHYFTIRVNDFELIDISYKTHPQWRLIDAVYASSCIPPIFQPLHLMVADDHKEWFIDGGFLANYPISHCMANIDKPEEDEFSILGFNINDRNYINKLSNDKTNLFEYIYIILSIIINKLTTMIMLTNQTKNHDHVTSYEININTDYRSTTDILSMVNSAEERRNMIEYGVTCANEFISNMG